MTSKTSPGTYAWFVVALLVPVALICPIPLSELRSTGYGTTTFATISCGGLADWGFGFIRDHRVPLHGIFGVFAVVALVSVVLVLLIRPRADFADAPAA